MTSQQIYEMSIGRFLQQTFFLFIFIFGHITILALTFPSLLNRASIFSFISFFVFLIGIISIPSTIILINYLRFSKDQTLTISMDELSLLNNKTNAEIHLKKNDVESVLHVINDRATSKFPWLFHEHLIIYSKHQDPIVITSYLTDISIIKLNPTFVNFLGQKTLKIEKDFFPSIQTKRS